MVNPFEDWHRELLSLSVTVVEFVGLLVCCLNFRLSPWVKVIAAGLGGILAVGVLNRVNFLAWQYLGQPVLFASSPELLMYLSPVGYLLAASVWVVGLWGFFRDIRRRLDAYQLHLMRLAGAPPETHGPARSWQPE